MINMFFIFLLLSVAHCLKPTATLYSSKACRACARFEYKFNSLKKEYDGILFEKIRVSDNMKEAFDNKVKSVPLLIFRVEDEEYKRFLGLPKQYKDIEETCQYLESCSKPEENIQSFQSFQSPIIDPTVLKCAKLCEKVYDDEYLHSCEHFVESKDTDCQASITRAGNTLFIAFRGSDSSTDWRINFKSSLVPYPSDSDRKVHAGFLIQWLSVKEQLLLKLQFILSQDKDIGKIVFCGHSAGAVCCLAAADFLDSVQGNTLVECEVVTFGSPRICNVEYRRHFEQRLRCTRVVLDRDVITRLPLPVMGYEHVGDPWQLRDNGIIRRDTNFLETIWWMLLGLPEADLGVRDHMIDKYVKAIENKIY